MRVSAVQAESFPGEIEQNLATVGMEVALAVCYDANFPEHAAAAAADGASVYVNGGGYFPGSGYRRDLHFGARALDNSMYAVFSGLVGVPYDLIGGTRIADLDPALVAEARADQRMWTDRRPDLGDRVRL